VCVGDPSCSSTLCFTYDYYDDYDRKEGRLGYEVVLMCPKRIHRLGTNGEGKSWEQSNNLGSPGKWPSK